MRVAWEGEWLPLVWGATSPLTSAMMVDMVGSDGKGVVYRRVPT